MLGALLALASAATFGFNNAAIRRGVLTGSVLQAMAITVPMGVPLFVLVCLPFGGIEAVIGFSPASWFWMAIAGIVHFVIGRYGNYRSTYALGANLATPIQQLSIPISIVLAMIFLEETMTPLRFFGFLLVMFGPTVMLRRKSGNATYISKSGFQPRFAEGILWGLISAFAYGTSPLFIMKGLTAEGGLIESLAGGLISYTAAAVVIVVLIFYLGGLKVISGVDKTAGKWFVISGIFVFLSQMFRYMSLAAAPVTVVVPIQRLSAVFRVIFSWILNREHEFFGFWLLLGIALSMLGAVMLALSTELALSLFPESWAPFLGFSWPNY
jgi:uncharacterized membrane protein